MHLSQHDQWIYAFITEFLGFVNGNIVSNPLALLLQFGICDHQGVSSEGQDDGHFVPKPQTAWQMSACMQKFGWDSLIHSPYSPDCAPSDFHLSGPLKKHLVCHRYHCESARTCLSVVLFTKPRILWRSLTNIVKYDLWGGVPFSD